MRTEDATARLMRRAVRLLGVGDVLGTLRSGFARRASTSRPIAWLAYEAPRAALAAALALLPGLLVLLAAGWSPKPLADAVTSTSNVHTLFARLLTATATASAIAVSVTTLALRREIRGVSGHRDSLKANGEFHDRMAKAAGLTAVPMHAGGVLATLFSNAERAAQRAAAELRRAGRADAEVGGVRADDLCRVIAERTAFARERVLAAKRPSKRFTAALDFENDLSLHLVRALEKDPTLPEAAREAVHDLHQRLDDLLVGTQYYKTIDTQWGFSRMATALLIASFVSILVSSAMVLAYGDTAAAAWGTTRAGALVGAALSLALLPFALFLAHLVRFLFLHRRTLSDDLIVMGPEKSALGTFDALQERPSGS